MNPRKTIVDTDPATGYRFRDVDDGLAILYLLARPEEFDVLGLTAVHGNASQRKTFEKAGEIVDVAGRPEVFGGSPGPPARSRPGGAQASPARRRRSSSRRRRLFGRPSPRMRMIPGSASGTTGGL